jgi:hypothetical protein
MDEQACFALAIGALGGGLGDEGGGAAQEWGESRQVNCGKASQYTSAAPKQLEELRKLG